MTLPGPGFTSGGPGSDPNWLLSSAAQCGATVVAIVAGLLVTRLLTLRSERAAAARAAEEYAERATAQEGKRDECLRRVQEQQALDWLSACLPRLVQVLRGRSPPRP